MSSPDFEVPAASVARIIKATLPANVQITKEARAAFTRAASIFIFYLTHCASDFSREGKRQTIYLQDVKNALRELDFEDFEGPLEEFLELYRKAEKESKGGGASKASSAAAAGAAGGGEDADMQLDGEGEGEADGDGDDNNEGEGDNNDPYDEVMDEAEEEEEEDDA